MPLNRRKFLQAAIASLISMPSFALTGLSAKANQSIRLNTEQSHLFRQWFSAIVRQQIKQGPSQRWTHRDCAGLVRFAVHETLREHDIKWRQASGFDLRNLPPEIILTTEQKAIKNQWVLNDGSKSAYINALGLIQNNSVFVGKNINRAKNGDLLFFDQGENQHLMIWLGNLIAYHTGTITKTDNGLRVVSIQELFNWKDTRWRIDQNNPNFIGFYRFAFLSR